SKECIAVIEWAVRAGAAVPAAAVRISIAHGAAADPRTDSPSTGVRELTLADPDSVRGAPLRSAIEQALESKRSGAPCPVCGKAVEPGDAQAPFCSPRCRSADLGRWLGERYRVSRPLAADDFEER